MIRLISSFEWHAAASTTEFRRRTTQMRILCASQISVDKNEFLPGFAYGICTIVHAFDSQIHQSRLRSQANVRAY